MNAQELIDGLRQKQQESARLLSQLETWALIKQRGVDPATVAVLGWETPKRQTGKEEWVGPWLRNSGFPRWLNFARLTDGSRVFFAPVPNTFADPDRLA